MKKGFTLIEVLVAATIIAVLASVAIVSYSTASKNSRDAKRKSDIANLAAALELYRADNDIYIAAGGAPRVEDVLGPLVSGGYINELPMDPKPYTFSTQRGYRYSNIGAGTGVYCLFAIMENTSNGNESSEGVNPCSYTYGDTLYSYFVRNP